MTPPVLAALVAVYFFWGTTYLGMKFAIETLPPFIMLGLRFTVAGAIMFAWEWVRLRPRITLGQWRGMGMGGALMLLGQSFDGLILRANPVIQVHQVFLQPFE